MVYYYNVSFISRFIFNMYAYAVKYLPIQSITRKFLVRGHTQNEGDKCPLDY